MDPPLHEFIPQAEEKQRELAREHNIKFEELQKRIEELHEQNPMLGSRGVRLGILYPEITETQFRALFQATAELMLEGLNPCLEIMVPLTMNVRELKHQKLIANKVQAEIEAQYKVKLTYQYGTMIETPRAALVANEISEVVDFFSFGTNDLTQMTLGFSRDDVNLIIHKYINNHRNES
jgi:pyruvate,orthophosphate dikinase